MIKSEFQPLFSYGTLQLERVQLETFGRPLNGTKETLLGWRVEQVEITDPAVLQTSAQTHHPILHSSKDANLRVDGTVFLITDAELAKADAYEVDSYKRVKATLASGGWTWVYVAAD